MRRHLLPIAALLTLLAFPAPAAPDAAAGDPIDLVSLDDRPLRLALGPEQRALVLHFWATWCPSCVGELALLDRAARGCRGAGVEVVAVNVAEDRETVLQYRAEHHLGLRVVRDPEGRAWRRASGRGLPANLVWTHEGVHTDVGPRDAGAWGAELAGLGCGQLRPPSPSP